MVKSIIFDTETTGKNEAKMIEAAWIQLDSINPFVTSEEFNQRYNPGKPIEFGALATHHILDEELIDCPTSESFELPQGLEYLIGHNVANIRFTYSKCFVLLFKQINGKRSP
jgi:exodeoxyribonuclease X